MGWSRFMSVSRAKTPKCVTIVYRKTPGSRDSEKCILQHNAADGLCLTLVSMSLTSLMFLHNQHPSSSSCSSSSSSSSHHHHGRRRPPTTLSWCVWAPQQGACSSRDVWGRCEYVCVCAQPVVLSLSASLWMCKCDNWVFQVLPATVSPCGPRHTHARTRALTQTQTSHSELSQNSYLTSWQHSSAWALLNN